MKFDAEDIILHKVKTEVISHTLSIKKDYKCPYCNEKHSMDIRQDVWHNDVDENFDETVERSFRYKLVRELEACEEKAKIRRIQELNPNKDSIAVSQEVCGNCQFSVTSEFSSETSEYDHVIGSDRWDGNWLDNPDDVACLVYKILIPEYGKCDSYEHDKGKDDYLKR